MNNFVCRVDGIDRFSLASSLHFLGNVEKGKIVFPDAASGRSFNETPHFGEQLLTLCRLHQLMIRCGDHHCDVLVRGKLLDPDAPCHAHVLKVSALLDLFALVANLLRHWRRPLSPSFANRLIAS